jgi:hypothetical protein
MQIIWWFQEWYLCVQKHLEVQYDVTVLGFISKGRKKRLVILRVSLFIHKYSPLLFLESPL